ncbi:hypothetical protein NliqN6_0893 [Naganishia liquefaciens]|uniref:Uncharacterized protein n=1 Tax=Naganishia liquefaciens TaxID=104408 RepID=A0A8H3YE77_9TREE|nr:hypothetical protein NliqN6_0893 [Naganishia liquefaciens]
MSCRLSTSKMSSAVRGALHQPVYRGSAALHQYNPHATAGRLRELVRLGLELSGYPSADSLLLTSAKLASKKAFLSSSPSAVTSSL